MSKPLHLGLDHFDSQIRNALAKGLGLDAESLKLERPRDEKLGQFAFPCFRFAKEQKANPKELAQKLADSFQVDSITPSATGPFLNFQIDPSALVKRVATDAAQSNYGAGNLSGKVVVEYSSPNIAKPMHVGHLRTTVIGAALSRLAERAGHDVARINHLGDWGSQFGKLVAAWNRWGNEGELENDPIAHLLQLYVRYHEEEKEDETLPADAKLAFQELESGEENETRAIWKRFTEFSLREFNRTFERLGSEFDFVRGESWYEDQLDPLLEWLESTGVLEESDGATIVDLKEHGIKTPCLVKTAHGTTLYATRDLAAAKSRWEEFQFEQALYVVGAEQNLHFQQFTTVLKKAGCEWANRIEHISFGLIRLLEGKLSTREGRVLSLTEVLDRAVELAAEIIEEKNPDLSDKEAVAERVGVGAILFHDLKHQRNKDVVFNWEEVLSFEGDTGPYLQYSHARCCAILRKSEREAPSFDSINLELLSDSPELFVALGRYPQALRESWEKREPMILAQHLLKMASAGNAFYRDKRVLGEKEELESARLCAIDLLRKTLADGLGILGVPTPEEM
ncbi:MAG: arginine--tRNA ligase [Planctomycetota bacterium]|jgi:arginyl-tRNA synthetase|nr:arginine--tRNA ligase [Planctomycetota bacterium]